MPITPSLRSHMITTNFYPYYGDDEVKPTYLKIKLKTLADEAKHIRKEEQKALKSARWLRSKQEDYHGMHELWYSLRRHRTWDVRRAARVNGLAYGYLRGREYKEMESRARQEPNWKDIKRLIDRFGGEQEGRPFEKWKAKAQVHYNEGLRGC